MDWSFLLFVMTLGIFLVISYAIILFNALGNYEIEGSGSYLDSPYWLTTPRDTRIMIIVFQLLAGVGYLYWILWTASKNDFTGPLQYRYTKFYVVTIFISSSALWPYFAYKYLVRPTIYRSIYASVPLWISALSVILMLAFTFETHANLLPTLSILLLSVVVVLFDGIGWSALCIQEATH